MWRVVLALLPVAAGDSDSSLQDFLSGISYRETHVRQLSLRYTVRTTMTTEGADVLTRYRAWVDRENGSSSPTSTVHASAHEILVQLNTDGRRFRLSEFMFDGGIADEYSRVAFDGICYRAFAPQTRTGQIVSEYHLGLEHPNSLGLEFWGEKLSSLLARAEITEFRESMLEGVPTLVVTGRATLDSSDPKTFITFQLRADEGRGYAVTRSAFGLERFGGGVTRKEHPVLEVETDELVELQPGVWYPKSGRTRDFVADWQELPVVEAKHEVDGPVHMVVVAENVFHVLDVHTPLTTADRLEIDWPNGTQVLDTIDHTLTIVGGEARQLLAAADEIRSDTARSSRGLSPLELASTPTPEGVSDLIQDEVISLTTTASMETEASKLEEFHPDGECGPRALFLALRSLGVACSWDEVKSALPLASEPGASMGDLKGIAELFGVYAKGVMITEISRIPIDVPILLYSDSLPEAGTHNHAGHFVLAYRTRDGNFALREPFLTDGAIRVAPNELQRYWQGHALMLARDPFQVQRGTAWQLGWGIGALLLSWAAVGWVRQRGPAARHNKQGAILIVMFFTSPYFAHGGEVGTQPETGAYTPVPAAVFVSTEAELGQVVPTGRFVEHRFEFSNDGTGPLILTKIDSSCECTTTLLAEGNSLASGESGRIQMRFDAQDRIGDHVATAVLHTNDPARPAIALTVRFTLMPAAHVLPTTVGLPRIPIGESTETAVELHAFHDPRTAEIASIRINCSPAWIAYRVGEANFVDVSAQLDRTKPLMGLIYPISLAIAPPTGTPVGPFTGHCSVNLMSPEWSTATDLQISGEVTLAAHYEPARIAFGKMELGASSTRVVRITTPKPLADDELTLTTNWCAVHLRSRMLPLDESNAHTREVVVTLDASEYAGRRETLMFMNTREYGSFSIPISVNIVSGAERKSCESQ